jgi:hypothetical protein
MRASEGKNIKQGVAKDDVWTQLLNINRENSQ